MNAPPTLPVHVPIRLRRLPCQLGIPRDLHGSKALRAHDEFGTEDVRRTRGEDPCRSASVLKLTPDAVRPGKKSPGLVVLGDIANSLRRHRTASAISRCANPRMRSCGCIGLSASASLASVAVDLSKATGSWSIMPQVHKLPFKWRTHESISTRFTPFESMEIRSN